MKPYEFPKLIIEEHEGFHIVRDDLLEGGSKRRFVDRLIREEIAEGAEEFVYGGYPANGYAQLSLTLQAKAYGKKAVFFMAKRSLDNLHPYQQQALDYAADIRWVSNGMLQVTKARAREYFYEDPKRRRILPLGLEEKRVFEDIKRLAKNIEIEYNISISEIWSVGSSGTLTRGLQMAFPDKDVNVVSVGHKMKQHEIGRAKLYLSDYKFTQEVKEEDKPPFPSVPTYDAKAWTVMKKYAKKGGSVLERRKITIARLRSGVNYKRPLDHIIDSFCYLLKRFEIKNTEFDYGVYNFGWEKANRRKPDDIPNSDIIIIPSENEFHYHIPNYIDPKNLEKSNTAIKEHFKDLKDKHIIILRSDRGDDEDLYRNHTFKDNPIRKVSILDETDIPGNLHQMKYHFIKDELPENNKRPYLFTYWGTEKRRDVGGVESGDQRHVFLKQTQDGMGRFLTRFIGRFSTVKRDMKPDSMRNILPILNQSKYTLCFNWKDNKATTSRYHEALACGIIPMVYKDYDSSGILVKDDWQRVESPEELCEKIMNTDYNSKFEQIHNTYKQSLLTKDQIYDTFESRLLKIINE